MKVLKNGMGCMSIAFKGFRKGCTNFFWKLRQELLTLFLVVKDCFFAAFPYTLQFYFSFVLDTFWLFWNKSIWKHPLSTANFCLFVSIIWSHRPVLQYKRNAKLLWWEIHMGRFGTNPLENKLCLALSTANFWKSKQKWVRRNNDASYSILGSHTDLEH